MKVPGSKKKQKGKKKRRKEGREGREEEKSKAKQKCRGKLGDVTIYSLLHYTMKNLEQGAVAHTCNHSSLGG